MSRRILRIGLFALSAAICGALSLSFASSATKTSSTTNAKGAANTTGARATATDLRHETFLVFPFENESRMANVDWLGEGLSELTAERLADRQLYVLSRIDRLATLERMGLPDSARFSHASMVKIGMEADADAIIYGRFRSDGKTLSLEARVLHLNPPSLSPPFMETSSAQDLLRAHARLAWQILCTLDRKNCLPEGANKDESSFSEPPPSLRLDALENFVRGIIASGDEERLRRLRDAARLEPGWDRPAFELGQIYSMRRDCDNALLWYSRVPPNRPDGPEASFAAGVCHLLRNDPARAEAAFSGLLERTENSGEADRLPELPEMQNNLGVARFRLGRLTEAGTEFERATTLDPEEADYHVNLGLARLAGKQAANAATEFDRAVKIDPEDKEARTLLIATLESLGRGSEAEALKGEANLAGNKTLPDLQDLAGLARLARVSRTLDRTLLRPSGDAAENQPPAAQGSRKGGSESQQ